MSKEETIEFLKQDHAKLELVIEALTDEMMISHRITGTWRVKDILAHISAWNFKLTEAIDLLLKNEKPWFIASSFSEAEFNKIQVVKRKSMSLREIVDEWRLSFIYMLKRIEILSDEEWEYKTQYEYQEGSAVTIESLFGYRYRGHGHEGGHAEQIEEYFDRDSCECEIY